MGMKSPVYRKLSDSELVIATHNEGKLHEIITLLAPFAINVSSAKSLNLPEPEETGETYLENALLKARACAMRTQKPSLADDSGLEIIAFNDEPGLHTSRFTKQHGGLSAVFSMLANNEALKKNPAARFVCVLVLYWPDGHYEHFTCVVEGRLVFPPRGNHGHGYDPVFIPNGHDRTFAEMNEEEKNRLSHRGRALLACIDACIA